MKKHRHANASEVARSSACLGLAACLALLLDGSALQTGFLAQNDAASLFIIVSAATFSMTCAALPFFMKHVGTHQSIVQFGPGFSALALISADILIAHSVDAGFSLAIAGCVFGAGLACGSVFWIEKMSRMPRKQLLALVSIALLFAAFFKAFCMLAPGRIADQAVTAMLLVACVARSPRRKNAVASPDFGNEEFTTLAQAMLKRNWALGVACIPYLVITAFTWSGNVRGMSLQNNPSTDSSWGMVVGLAGASLLLLIVGIQNSSSVFKRVSACAPMACVAFAAVSWVAGNFTADGIPKIIASSALGFGLSCILSLLVISLAFEAHENPHALAIGEIALSLCALLFVICYATWPLLGDAVASTVSIVLCIMLLVVPALLLPRLSSNQAGSTPTRSNEDRIQSVADRYCLTKREREVLALLAEGRTAAYIAQRQFVSVNTVRTHVKRIYVKMDVTSRQQLLDVTHEDQL